MALADSLQPLKPNAVRAYDFETFGTTNCDTDNTYQYWESRAKNNFSCRYK